MRKTAAEPKMFSRLSSASFTASRRKDTLFVPRPAAFMPVKSGFAAWHRAGAVARSAGACKRKARKADRFNHSSPFPRTTSAPGPPCPSACPLRPECNRCALSRLAQRVAPGTRQPCLAAVGLSSQKGTASCSASACLRKFDLRWLR